MSLGQEKGSIEDTVRAAYRGGVAHWISIPVVVIPSGVFDRIQLHNCINGGSQTTPFLSKVDSTRAKRHSGIILTSSKLLNIY